MAFLDCHLIDLLLLIVFIPTLSMTAVLVPNEVVRFSLGNITVTKVVTASQPTTTTKSTLFTCTTLAAPLVISPCQSRMQLWGVPIFYTVVHEDIDQFHSVNPTHVFKVETSVVTAEEIAGIYIPIVYSSSADVEPSFDDSDGKTTTTPVRSNLFSAFFSSLLSGWQFPTVITRTETVYTATSTSTYFTSTSTYTLAVVPPCLPADFVACPTSQVEETTTTEEDPSTDISI